MNVFHGFFFSGIKRKKEENFTLRQQTPTMKEGSGEMDKNDELREEHKALPPIIVRKAELNSAQRV